MTSVRHDRSGTASGSQPPTPAPKETSSTTLPPPPPRLGVYSPVAPEIQARLGAELRQLFLRDAGFNRNRFAVDAPWIARTLDAGWQEQVIVDSEAHAVEQFAAAVARGESPEVAFDNAVVEAGTKGIASRDSMADLWNAADSEGLLVGYGSARTGAIKAFGKDLVLLVKGLAEACVRAGISNGNGAAETGGMGLQSDCWHEAKQVVASPAGKEANIYHAFLGMYPADPSAHREPPSTVAAPEHRSQPLRTFLNRTTFLMSLGDQRVNLVLPGGVGTVEELFRVMAEIKKSDDVNGPYTARKAPQVYILNIARPGETLRCYDELKRLWQGAIASGAMKEEDLANVHWVEDISSESARSSVVQSIIGDFQGVGDPEAWLRFNGRWNGEDQKIAQATVQLVEALPEFKHRRFVDKSDHLRIFDAMYQSQVTVELAEHAVGIAAAARSKGEGASVARENALEWVRNRALGWRDSAARLIERLHDREVLTIIGSAKEDVWDESLQADLTTRIDGAVRAGMPVILGGDGKEGISRRAFDLWVSSMTAYREQHGHESSSEFVRAEFKLSGELRERRKQAGYAETLSPPLTSVLLRSELLLVLGGKRSFAVYPGGVCELEVAARAILGKQLNGVVDTYCTRQGAEQKITFISGTEANCRDFYAPLRAFLDELVRINTVSLPDLGGVHFEVAAR